MANVIQICNMALTRIGVRDFISALSDTSLQARVCNQNFGMTLDTVTAEFAWPFATKHASLSLVAAPYAAWSNATTYAVGANVTVGGTAGFFTSLVANNINNAPPSNPPNSNAFWTYVPTYTRTGWNYMYALPADCVEVQRIQFQPDLGIGGPFVGSPPIPQPWWMRQQLPHGKPEWIIEADDAGDGGTYLLTNMVVAELVYTMSLQNVEVLPAMFSDALAWLLARELAMALPNKADYAKGCQDMYGMRINTAVARAINSGQQQHEPESEFIVAR